MSALVWLTRDLRVHDHPALRAALDRADRVGHVFCFDDRLLSGRNASGPRTQFMLECLADLDERLGGTLVIRRGLPERELTALAREAESGEVHFSADSRPFARRRIDRVTGALAEAGAAVRSAQGAAAVAGVARLEHEVEEPLPGGESAARERLSRFLGDGVREYSDNHDALGRDKTSRLSPYLHFGCLSPREVESRLPRGRGADAFRRQLCWRDF